MNKKNKMQIDIIYASINVLNVKRKHIEKASFNVFISKKNNYFNVNITYIPKKNDYLHIYMIFLNELND